MRWGIKETEIRRRYSGNSAICISVHYRIETSHPSSDECHDYYKIENNRTETLTEENILCTDLILNEPERTINNSTVSSVSHQSALSMSKRVGPVLPNGLTKNHKSWRAAKQLTAKIFFKKKNLKNINETPKILKNRRCQSKRVLFMVIDIVFALKINSEVIGYCYKYVLWSTINNTFNG